MQPPHRHEGLHEDAPAQTGSPQRDFDEDIKVAQLEKVTEPKKGFFEKLFSCFKTNKKDRITESIKFPEPLTDNNNYPSATGQLASCRNVTPFHEIQPLKVVKVYDLARAITAEQARVFILDRGCKVG